MTEFVDKRGFVWKPYSVSFDSPDGVFVVELWAISDDHAQLQLQALKDTARLDGVIVEKQK